MKSVIVEPSKEQPTAIHPGQLITDTGGTIHATKNLVLLVIEIVGDRRYKCMAVKCPPYEFGYIDVWSGPVWLPFSGKITLEQ